MIRVLVADDDNLVRQGIRHLLSLAAGIEVVGEAADGDETLARIGELSPEVVLLDARMPRRSGLEVLAALAGVSKPPPCLLLTTFDDSALFLEAVRLGARGYLRKDVSLEELLAAIRTLAEGKTFLQPAVTQRLLERAAPAGSGPSPSRGLEDSPPLQLITGHVTARELEVLRLMAGGFSNREIGEALGTAEGTVKIQVSSILGKLGARDRTQAVVRALAAGLIGPARGPMRGPG